MDYGRVALVICLVLIIVVGINAALYFGLANKGAIGQINMLRNAGKRARNPWQPEDADLKELNRLVKELKEKKPPEGE